MTSVMEIGCALIKSDQVPFGGRPYSTHRIVTRADGTTLAEAGNYYMTLNRAMDDFQYRNTLV
jgi:hypothetical protein